MKVLAYIRSMGVKFFRRSQLSAEMDEELRSHVALRAEDLERSGVDREEAQRRARIEFGGEEKVKEECHQALEVVKTGSSGRTGRRITARDVLRKEVLQAALGRAFKLLTYGSAAGLLLGILASRVLAFIVAQATPRDPLVLAGVVCAMAVLGLFATWIPARRALSIDLLRLLREE
jgi:hypothetical protein